VGTRGSFNGHTYRPRAFRKMLSSRNLCAIRSYVCYIYLTSGVEWALNIRLAATSGEQTIAGRLMMIDAGHVPIYTLPFS